MAISIHNCNAQNFLKCDSLKLQLKSAKSESIKTDCYEKLCKCYQRQRDSINLEKTTWEFYNYTKNISGLEKSKLTFQSNGYKSRTMALIALGNIPYSKQNFDSALTWYTNALYFSEQNYFVQGIAKANFNIGRAWRWKNKLDSADLYLNKALHQLQQFSDEYLKSEVLNESGVVLQKREKNTDALKIFEKAMLLKIKLDDEEGQMRVLANMGACYSRLGDYDKAKSINHQLLEYYLTKGTEAELATAYSRCGAMAQLNGQYDSALFYHHQSVLLYNKYNDRIGLALANNYLGITYKEMGNLDIAYIHFQKSNDLYKELGILNRIASSSFNMGNVLLLKGHYLEALQIYLESKRNYEKVDDNRGIAQCYGSMGDLYLQMKNYTAAKENLNEALRLGKQLQLKRDIALDLQSLAKVFEAENNFDSALVYYSESLQLWIKLKDSVQWSGTLNSVAQVELDKKNYAKAIEFFNKAIEVSKNAGSKPIECTGKIGLSQTYLDMASTAEKVDSVNILLNEAKKFATNSLNYATNAGNADLLLKAWDLLIIIEQKLNNYKQAIQYINEKIALRDSLYNIEKAKQLKEIETKYETEKKDNEILLLNNRTQLQALSIKEQNATLLAKELEFQKKENEVAFLNQSKEIQQLQLIQSQKNYLQRAAEAKNKSAQLEIAQRDRALQQQEIESQKLIRNGIIVIAGFLIVIALFMINRIHLRKRIEKQQAVLIERRRISSDMHDDLGSGLSSIAILSEVVKKHLTDKQDINTLEKISHSAQQSLEKMSEIVWSLNPKNDTIESLISYIRKYTAEYFEPTAIECKINLPQQMPSVTLSGEQRRNIFLVVKESLHNIIKHSCATTVEVNIAASENQFSITIHDNGKGIDLSQNNAIGNGLLNMQHRMKESGGRFSIKNQDGTTAQLSLQLS